MNEISRLQTHLEAIEIGRQRDPEAGDMSDPEEEAPEIVETPVQESAELKLLMSVLGTSSGPKPELSTYDGSLTAENLIDWVSDLDKYIEYDEIDEEKKVKFVVTRLKGHASLWWDSVQAEMRKKNKPVIESWDRMVAKMRGKFLPKDYQLALYRQADAEP